MQDLHARDGTHATLRWPVDQAAPLIALLLLALPACKSDAGGADGSRGATDAGPGADDVASASDTPSADTNSAADGAAGTEGRPSAGCTAMTARYPPGRHKGQLVVAGETRTFVLEIPAAYDRRRAAPLVMLFHGGLGTGAQMEESSRFSPIAEREGIVAVYPDGLGRTWNAGRCCGRTAERGSDDVGFIAALLDHLEGELCLDRRRVYAGGMSNGAMMSHRLGCELSQRLAAIAPVAGTNMTDGCSPKRPMPVMHIHGSEDQHVPWQGGMGCGLADVPYVSVPDSISGWTGRNGCTPALPKLVLEQGNGRCERHGSCPGGAEIILCTITGGGHSWPGGEDKESTLPACQRAGEGPQSRTFLASEQIWAFFKTHALP